MKLNFLSVAFFLPCRPFIVVPMLLARILEGHTDLSKLLFIARRPVPTAAALSHRSQSGYVAIIAVLSVVWSVALSLVTYNEKLYLWWCRERLWGLTLDCASV